MTAAPVVWLDDCGRSRHRPSRRLVLHAIPIAPAGSFGADITPYEWVYTVAPQRVGAPLALLGGQEDDDILTALAVYCRHHGGRINDLLQTPEVAADFSNWHS